MSARLIPRLLARATPAGPSAAAARPRPRAALPALAAAPLRFASSRAQPTGLGEGERAIWDQLDTRFPGKQLEVQDVSGGCGAFYAILVSSPEFKGLSMVKQHKLVNDCLKDTIKDIHGLQLKTIAEDA